MLLTNQWLRRTDSDAAEAARRSIATESSLLARDVDEGAKSSLIRNRLRLNKSERVASGGAEEEVGTR